MAQPGHREAALHALALAVGGDGQRHAPGAEGLQQATRVLVRDEVLVERRAHVAAEGLLEARQLGDRGALAEVREVALPGLARLDEAILRRELVAVLRERAAPRRPRDLLRVHEHAVEVEDDAVRQPHAGVPSSAPRVSSSRRASSPAAAGARARHARARGGDDASGHEHGLAVVQLQPGLELPHQRRQGQRVQPLRLRLVAARRRVDDAHEQLRQREPRHHAVAAGPQLPRQVQPAEPAQHPHVRGEPAQLRRAVGGRRRLLLDGAHRRHGRRDVGEQGHGRRRMTGVRVVLQHEIERGRRRGDGREVLGGPLQLRRQQHHRGRGAVCLRPRRPRRRDGRVGVADAGHDRHGARVLGQDRREHQRPLRLVEVRRLAHHAEGRQPARAAPERAPDRAAQRRHVDRARRVERRGQDVEEPLERRHARHRTGAQRTRTLTISKGP